MNIYCAWLIALWGGLLSLWYSEVLHISPCQLCWWQRSALFPLILLLGIAAFRRDRWVAVYAVPLAAIGMSVALVQHFLGAQLCSACSVQSDQLLTAASAAGFFLIGAFLLKKS